MAITKRCIRCRKKVRDDGSCQNKQCVLYVSKEKGYKTTKSTFRK